MSRLIKVTFLTLVSSVVFGCSSFNSMDSFNVFTDGEPNPQTRLCADDMGEFHECHDMLINNTQLKVVERDPRLFHADFNFQRLGEYTEQMATDMQFDLRDSMIDTPVAMASFVYLDSSLQSTNELGIQLAESLMSELQNAGLPMSDHKLTGFIKVNPQGDFVFSRNQLELQNNPNIGYVVTGTMIKNARGVMVNARMINIKSNEVKASASKFLPNAIVENLI